MRLIETEEDYTTTTGKLAVVVFSAGWCRNCKMIKSHLDTLAAAHPTVEFCTVDVGTLEDVAAREGVSSLPHIVGYAHGAKGLEYFGSKKETVEAKVLAFLAEHEGAAAPAEAASGSGGGSGGAGGSD